LAEIIQGDATAMSHYKLIVVPILVVMVLALAGFAAPRPVQAQGTAQCPILILMQDILIVRASPSFRANTTTTLARGESVCLNGRTADATWVQIVRLQPYGVAGWGPANAFWTTVPITVLPVVGSTGTPTTPPTQQVYVVQAGDTLFAISRRFGVTVQAIATANNINPFGWVYVGQRLIIPGAGTTPTPPPTPTYTTYVVQRGEYLVSIARKYNLNWYTLATFNSIPYPYVIYPGQTLLIPSAG
jgi:LysM repeat protein